MIRYLKVYLFLMFLPSICYSQLIDYEILYDSTENYGIDIEPILLEYSRSDKVLSNFNYAPCINRVLKENKYIKFPNYLIPIGIDSLQGNNNTIHLSIRSGNRLYFPVGGGFKCPDSLKTNGYMLFFNNKVDDVFINNLKIVGAKANKLYKTSPYGAGIALYGAKNIKMLNIRIDDSTGDGLTIRTSWSKQCENITLRNININNATRVGVLITGIVNGNFDKVSIRNTGESNNNMVLKPQTALSFEPNDCTGKYENCIITNLFTENTKGAVLGTANFHSEIVNKECDKDTINIRIENWTDINNIDDAYGSVINLESGNIQLLGRETEPRSYGSILFKNLNFIRNSKNEKHNRKIFSGKDENLDYGVKYIVENLNVNIHNKEYNLKNYKGKDIETIFTDTKKVKFIRVD